MIHTPAKGPKGHGPNTGREYFPNNIRDTKGSILDDTRDAEKAILSIDNTSKSNESNNANTTIETSVRPNDQIKIMKASLDTAETDDKNIENTDETGQTIPTNEITEEEKKGVLNRIKGKWDTYTGKNLISDLKKALDDMVEAGIITADEKAEIRTEIDNPKVQKAISTQISALALSGAWTIGNFCIATPAVAITAAIIGTTARTGFITFLTFYTIKRFALNRLVSSKMKGEEGCDRVSTRAMIPGIGERAPLVELCKYHKTVPSNLLGLKKTTGKRKKFHNETDPELRKKYGAEWKQANDKTKAWLDRWLKRLKIEKKDKAQPE